MFVELIAVQLVIFHSVDGREIAINPKQVTSMYAAREDAQNKLFAKSIRCVIALTDGKYITVAENCDHVKQVLEDAERSDK